MRITSRGQVTIPADIRERAGQLPHTILVGRIDDLVGEALVMADDAFDVLLEHGLHIQPLAIEEGSLEHPEAHPAPHLTRCIAAEGVRL